jgi:hypothetical protein
MNGRILEYCTHILVVGGTKVLYMYAHIIYSAYSEYTPSIIFTSSTVYIAGEVRCIGRVSYMCIYEYSYTCSFNLQVYDLQTSNVDEGLLAWDESVHLVYTIKKEYSMLDIGYMQHCLPVGEIPTAHASRTNKHNIMQVEQLLNWSNSEGVVFYAFYENS